MAVRRCLMPRCLSRIGVVELQPHDLANGILHSYTTQEEVIDELIVHQLV